MRTTNSTLTRRSLAVGLCLLSAALAHAGGAGRFAIRAGKVLTVSGETIDHGVVLVSGGKIEAVGPAADVAIPKGYSLIDAPDRWLMPGMVEIHSHAGVQGGLNDMVSHTNPGMRIGDGVNADSEIVRMALSAGVTAIQTVPGSGTNHGGFGVAFKTFGKSKSDVLIRRVSILKATQAYNPERRAGDIGATRMGMAWVLREHFDRAKEYDRALSEFEAGKRKIRPAPDIALDMTRPVFHGELPVLVHTYETWGMLMTMAMFGEQYGTPAIATHCAFNGHRSSDTVGKLNFRVNIGPRVVDLYGNGDARFRGMIPTYAEGGTTELSVNTDSFGFGQTYLAVKAAMAARFGLDDKQAIELVTINAARAALLDDRIGSIEVGKDADLIIKQSSILDPTTPVEMVFVNGEIAYAREAEN